ncbi:MAG TPA: peptide MFS transporter [Steroidobacteraceae bacterium]|nr:peptide MFS transporter [Steroidobacteraceae bacterium]
MSSAVPAPPRHGFLGHPAGFSTLFFTELWERFSYYGMRAILLLFLVAQVQSGGFGLDDRTAAAVYGLYTAGVYIASLPGGWIADRVLGAQRAVLYGGLLIMSGHGILAFAHQMPAFLLGLAVIVVGTGLLKPNISAMVGAVQHGSPARRDAAFTLFYMAINIGATVGPILVAWLAQRFGWHVGFGAAAIGMAAGLGWYLRSRHLLGQAGLAPPGARPATLARDRLIMWAMLAAIVLLAVLLWSGALRIDALVLQGRAIQFMALAVVLYFLWLLLFAGLDGAERRRVVVLMVLIAASTLFWAGYEQAGSSLTLFAERFTDRHIGSWEFPAGWFQSVQAVFVLTCAPLLTLLWMRLDGRGRQMSVITKFALGLAGMGLGFLVMVGGAMALGGGQAGNHGASPFWLILAYLMHVLGELFLSPVGMSATTRLVPQRFSGQGMGLWFASLAMGNLFASRLAGELGGNASSQDWSAYFLRMCGYAAIAVMVLLALLPLLRRWAAPRPENATTS